MNLLSIRRIVYLACFLVITSALYYSVKNTWKWATDFYGLVILVSVSNEERSFNPYSNDFLWLTQDMAAWAIKNLKYPYEQCGSSASALNVDGCEYPKILYSSGFIGWAYPETEPKIYEILRFLIQRGEPIDAYGYEGFTALQSAILANEPELVSFLLEHGADPNLVITRSESAANGMNSFEFLELLSVKNPGDFSEMEEVFNQYLLANSVN